MQRLIRFPLDTTGSNKDNLVIGEEHVLVDKRVRAVAPYYGAFFGDSVQVFDVKTNKELVRDKDWVTADLLQKQTLTIGQPINTAILIISREVSDTVRINYQVLGGDHFRHDKGTENLLNVKDHDELSYKFIDINKRPNSYKPTFHLHAIADIYGFEYVMFLLEKLRNAIIWSKSHLIRELLNRLEAELEIAKNNTLKVADNTFKEMISNFRLNFDPLTYQLDKFNNYGLMTKDDVNEILDKDKSDLTKEAYLHLEALAHFKERLYSLIVNKSKTNLGYEYGSVGLAKKEVLANLANGNRFFLESLDVYQELDLEYDLTVFPNTQAKRTRFVIWKISNFTKRKGGVFLAIDQVNLKVYSGRLTEYGNNLLMEWKEFKDGKFIDEALVELVNHLGDTNNPHKDTKETVQLDVVENLSTATKLDILSQSMERKYISYDLLDLFMKGYLSTQEDEHEIKPDPDVNVMKRFDVLFTPCGDNCNQSTASKFCGIEVEQPKFRVFTQRPNYRTKEILDGKPELKDINPVIIEGITKRMTGGFEVVYTTESGHELINLPEVLNPGQTWNYGTLYQGFRSGVEGYELTDPFYDTYLVVRGSSGEPRLTGAKEVYWVKSFKTLLDEAGSINTLSNQWALSMRDEDWLIKFRAFDRPEDTASEDEVLEFEKKEQVVKLEIFAVGYTFYVDIRNAIYENYQFITLKEKHSPKLIPMSHLGKDTPDWLTTEEVDTSENANLIVIGDIIKDGKAKIFDVKADNGLNNTSVRNLFEKNKTNPLREAYYYGAHGMPTSSFKLENDGSYEIPDVITPDPVFRGRDTALAQMNKLSYFPEEQRNLNIVTDFVFQLEPFIQETKRPLPHDGYKFSNPFATGSVSIGDNKRLAYDSFITTGVGNLNDYNKPFKSLYTEGLYGRVGAALSLSSDFYVSLEQKEVTNEVVYDALYRKYINYASRPQRYYQPTLKLPYAEQLEIPKRVNAYYKHYYRLEPGQYGNSHYKEIKESQADSNSAVIELIEVGCQQPLYTEIISSDVEYNALFVNTCILKYWKFKNLKPVFTSDDYSESSLYPVYPEVKLDEGLVDEQLVGIYTLINTVADDGSMAQFVSPMGATGKATIVPGKKEIIVEFDRNIKEDLLESIKRQLSGNGLDTNYEVVQDRFNTYDIQYGTYTSDDKIEVNFEEKYLKINLSHKSEEEIKQYLSYHLRYIEWEVKAQPGTIIRTSTLYPVVTQDQFSMGFEFLHVSSKAIVDNISFGDDKYKASFEFISIATPVTVRYSEVKYDEKIKVGFDLISVTTPGVIYTEINQEDKIQVGFEFLEVGIKLSRVEYGNYRDDKYKVNFEFIGVETQQTG